MYSNIKQSIKHVFYWFACSAFVIVIDRLSTPPFSTNATVLPPPPPIPLFATELDSIVSAFDAADVVPSDRFFWRRLSWRERGWCTATETRAVVVVMTSCDSSDVVADWSSDERRPTGAPPATTDDVIARLPVLFSSLSRTDEGDVEEPYGIYYVCFLFLTSFLPSFLISFLIMKIINKKCKFNSPATLCRRRLLPVGSRHRITWPVVPFGYDRRWSRPEPLFCAVGRSEMSTFMYVIQLILFLLKSEHFCIKIPLNFYLDNMAGKEAVLGQQMAVAHHPPAVQPALAGRRRNSSATSNRTGGGRWQICDVMSNWTDYCVKEKH